jgi:hypothetical protein
MGEMRNAYKILIREPEDRGQIERSRRRWEDNIKMHFKEIEVEDVDWIRSGSGLGPVAGVFGQGSEFSGSVEGGELFGRLWDHQLL